jgi:hypothetical protein
LHPVNGFIEEKSLEWKNCFGDSTDGAACITDRNAGLVAKIKDMGTLTDCERIATFIGETWQPKKGNGT